MDIKLFKQYQEGLIRLVEKNQDKEWLSYFVGMRKGGVLPQGGAGSLNDWGPIYLDLYEQTWYSCLYDILMELYRKRLYPNKINQYRTVKNRHTAEILMCSNCKQKFQHPNVFEKLISTEYYAKHLEKMINSLKLELIFDPLNSYKSDEANNYRKSLNRAYQDKGILLYDFVKNKYICYTCERRVVLAHIKYTIKHNIFMGKITLNNK